MNNIRVGIIGCGKIADQHMAAIKRIRWASVCGLCDREGLMAEQLAERFGVDYWSADAGAMLEAIKPDVVHITTPPQSHFALAQQCLSAGCHVYVEKPFTVNTEEAASLLRIARERNLGLTVGHNLQFVWESLEARKLVREGFLGGPPIHIESYYTYDLGDPRYARAQVGDKDHWAQRLPGGLIHNVMSHGIARIAEFILSEQPSVTAFGHVSPTLQAVDETSIVDELRLHVFDGRNTTGTFVFSSQLRPPMNGCRLYGSKASLIVDNVQHTVVRLDHSALKSYAHYFLSPLKTSSEYFRASTQNLKRFLQSEFHDDSGLKNLIEAFYRAIRGERPLPIPYSEILTTSRIIDAVVDQLNLAPREVTQPCSATLP